MLCYKNPLSNFLFHLKFTLLTAESCTSHFSFPLSSSSHWSMFDRLPLTGESAVGSLLIIQPQRGRVTVGDALIVIGQLWTPGPPTCKRGQRSNKSSQAQREGVEAGRKRGESSREKEEEEEEEGGHAGVEND